MGDQEVTAEVKSVGELFEEGLLTIPDYQRPYKWETRHVRQLLQDIEREAGEWDKTGKPDSYEYRLGSVIVHRKNDNEIVDGQQRLVTLTLALNVLGKTDHLPLLEAEFSSDISKRNILANHEFIKNKWANDGQHRDLINFILDRCTVVVIRLHDLDEAFQLFDSQNARGKTLEPHDLLKAYHLREMSDDISEERKLGYVKRWEEAAAREEHARGYMTLTSLIGLYLYRIRRWAVGLKAGEFTKEEIGEFKGITICKHKYRYVRTLQEVSALSDCRLHQINEPIVNGHCFFEYVLYYLEMGDRLFPNVDDNDQESRKNDETGIPIYKKICSYDGWWRTGDGYVRRLFKAAVLHYHDKFENHHIDQAAESIFQ